MYFYYFVGLNYSYDAYNPVSVSNYKSLLAQYVNITPLLLIPPLILIIFTLLNLLLYIQWLHQW